MKDMIQTTVLPIEQIEANKGQIPGVPANPRILDADDYDRLVKSIKDDPEMLQLRELIVYPYQGKYVVMGGNMRFHVLTVLGHKEAPCKVLDAADTTFEQLKAIIIKDNVNYGEWDESMLRGSWQDEPLDDWGVHLEPIDEEPEQKEETNTLQLKFTPNQFRFIKQKLNSIDKDNAKAIIQLLNEYGS